MTGSPLDSSLSPNKRLVGHGRIGSLPISTEAWNFSIFVPLPPREQIVRERERKRATGECRAVF